MEEHSKSRTPTETALSVHREGQSKNWPSVGVGPEDHGAHSSWISVAWGWASWYKVWTGSKRESPPPLYAGRKESGFTLSVWPLGYRSGLPFSQDGVPTLSQPPGGSRPGTKR